ncbi:hypothetical protein AQJ54_35930 [Streptomyces griseorubiginosus]|uniref:Uncharacterized protein n=1 Tax=Streptomyces griseorubiginosus TaxID=67304 RepID=A0A124HW64_9ACTN|nr:hypothetical protein AQJ54_35930 [Streptomyces griseorubiginosus]
MGIVSAWSSRASLIDLLGKLLELQPSWTAANTEEMHERGVIIRQLIPDLLRAEEGPLSTELGVPLDDFTVKGRDGTGLK